MMRTKQGALDSTVQTHLRTKARVCVCVCVRCGGEGGALIVKARVYVCMCVLWGQAWGSACEGP